jgi:hypothetical protein
MLEDQSSRFENFFVQRAFTADTLKSADSFIISTVSLDSLAEIWLNDFPHFSKDLNKQYGGKIPGNIRLSKFLKNFANDDPNVCKVAVVCFAEDLKKYIPVATNISEKLLDKRIPPDDWGLAQSYLDVSIEELFEECPELTQLTQLTQIDTLKRIIEEYEYGSILYVFYRCSLVHKLSAYTHGFCIKEEIRYNSSPYNDRWLIGFGPQLITRWLRIATSNYVQFCRDNKVIPGDGIDLRLGIDDKLKNKFLKLASKLNV